MTQAKTDHRHYSNQLGRPLKNNHLRKRTDAKQIKLKRLVSIELSLNLYTRTVESNQQPRSFDPPLRRQINPHG